MKNYTYLNPVVTQRADPYIYKHIDGYYYFWLCHNKWLIFDEK